MKQAHHEPEKAPPPHTFGTLECWDQQGSVARGLPIAVLGQEDDEAPVAPHLQQLVSDRQILAGS